ncbi:hypothetical protein [Mariniflexile sp. AS56]|uniref:tetratricopeptide repeat-containing sensor histidine kinase n=1 Tax=Mariniflexile sp. AS56 TaxID=3063957 RepID=UPI0026EAA17E|nr:hypothetical protein [Mariniflexile sp. AS56]MDO7173865.1 hypothetical protein [Mariniflexile sp. AS56]
MRNIYFLILILANIFIWGCKENNDTIPFENIYHKTTSLFSIAQDKTNPIEERYLAINRAYSIVKDIDDTLYDKILYQKSAIHYVKGQIDSVKQYNRVAFSTLNNPYYLGKFHYLEGYVQEIDKHQVDSAFYHYHLSKDYFIQAKDSTEIGKKILLIGQLEIDTGQFHQGIETLTEGIVFLETKNTDSIYLASTYNNLGIANKFLLNFEDAIKNYQYAQKITPNKQHKILYQNNIAVAYKEMGEFSKAESILETLLKDSLTINSEIEKARILDNWAYARWKSGITDSIEQFFIRAMHLREKQGDENGLQASYMHLGEYYQDNNKTLSNTWFDKKIELSKLLNNPKEELEALKIKLKNIPHDVDVRDRYIELQDSILNEELKVSTRFAKIKYDFTRKQNELDAITIENLAQKNALVVKENQNITYLSLAALLLILVIFTALYLKNKIKVKSALSRYETESEISKKIHDTVGNDLSGILSYISISKDINRPENKSIIMQGLNKAYQRARIMSRDIAPIDTTNFNQTLEYLFQHYRSTETTLQTNLTACNWAGIPDYKLIALYRVLQELLSNTNNHANASTITIFRNTSTKDVEVTYTDNGVGCDLGSVRRNGLISAENRIENIQGNINFRSNVGEGFKARINLHLKT